MTRGTRVVTIVEGEISVKRAIIEQQSSNMAHIFIEFGEKDIWLERYTDFPETCTLTPQFMVTFISPDHDAKTIFWLPEFRGWVCQMIDNNDSECAEVLLTKE